MICTPEAHERCLNKDQCEVGAYVFSDSEKVSLEKWEKDGEQDG